MVRDLSLRLKAGEVYLLLGRNGAGKTTLLLTVAGLLPIAAGDISLRGQSIRRLDAHARVARGMALVQEGKRIFRRLTVEQNLRVGLYTRKGDRHSTIAALDTMYQRFPILQQMRHLAAGALSGGQQQMLAIAQALIPNPDIVLLDEPSAGLAPAIVDDVMRVISDLKAEGKAVLLVEQSIQGSLQVADKVGVMDDGHIAFAGAASELTNLATLQEIYMGVNTRGTSEEARRSQR